MSMDYSSASHNLRYLTQHVTISDQERTLWNKTMFEAIKCKIKITKSHARVAFFLKSKQKNIGTPAIN